MEGTSGGGTLCSTICFGHARLRRVDDDGIVVGWRQRHRRRHDYWTG